MEASAIEDGRRERLRGLAPTVRRGGGKASLRHGCTNCELQKSG
jgi:hypothetical protein